MKVQTNVSDEMVKRIDVLAKQMGVSRSALCSVAIGQYVMSLEKSLSIVDGMGAEAIKFLNQKKLEE